MGNGPVRSDMVMEAGIAAHLVASPTALPDPSVYFQDFNFGGTMWDAAYGNVDGGSISGVGDAVADIAIDNAMKLEAKRREEDNPAKDAGMIVEAGEQQREALAQMQARSAQLGHEIAQMESQFEAEMGDAWREIFANEILDPDEIPQRRDGETMEQYRARLEAVLVAEMIDANGNIKSEYADSPYARWARAEFEKREVDGWINRRTDPSTAPAQAAEMDNDIVQNGTFNQLQQGDTKLVVQGTESEVLASGTDNQRDEVEVSGAAESQSEMAVFSSPSPPAV